MKKFLLTAKLMGLFFALAATGIAQVHAQAYPSKPITFVIGFPPGGSDIFARLFAATISKSVGQPIVVENKPGANGFIAAEYVKKAAPDGYTFLFTNQGEMILNHGLFDNVPYDTGKDFVAVSPYTKFAFMVVVGPASSAKTLAELVAQAKAQPGKIALGTTRNGMFFLALETFKRRVGVDMPTIPFKGSSLAVQDLLGGQIPALVIDPTSPMVHVRAGKLTALAITSRTRMDLYPDIPTVSETVAPGYESVHWGGIVTTANTPREAIERMNAEIGRAIKLPEVAERFAALGTPTWHVSSQEFGEYMKEELRTLPGTIRKLNISVN